jgi:hypothetical protein
MDGDMAGNDFLFTWKPKDKWPPEYMQRLARKFKEDGPFVERWRRRSNRLVRNGDRAYVYKQGKSPNGIFAVGTVVGPASHREHTAPGESSYEVPIRFEVFVDPSDQFLVTKDDLLKRGVSPTKLRTQASGVQLGSPIAARMTDNIAANGLRRNEGTAPAEERERRRETRLEAYFRDSARVRELRQRYDGRWQICGFSASDLTSYQYN